MAEPVDLALAAAKSLIMSDLDLTGIAPVPTIVAVFPDEYTLVSDLYAGDLPVIIIGEGIGIPQRITRHTHGGRSMHHWTMEIAVLLAEGPIVYPSAESAAAEMRQKGWRDAMKRLFFANMTLNGTAAMIGAERSGEYVLFDANLTSWQWNQRPYYALLFLMAVQQASTVEMKA